MTPIWRIFADFQICVNPFNPRHLRSVQSKIKNEFHTKDMASGKR